AARLLSKGDSERLTQALQLYQALMQVLRLCVDGPFDPDEAPRGLLDLLARTAAMPDFGRLDAHLRDVEADVRSTFEKIIGKMPEPG
ncbi:MAG: hypothetical protein GY788_10150, partial [bacterium]|nr:hypothetical protein [bacterium]